MAGGTPNERTFLLRALAEAEGGIVVEVGKFLSTTLLDLPAPLRTASVAECFSSCLTAPYEKVTCLDHLEILFETTLMINPVRLVKNASQRKLIVASWPGTIATRNLLFGPPNHPAHIHILESELESVIYRL